MSRAERRTTSTPRSLAITLVVAAAMFITGIPTAYALPAYSVTASGGTTSTSESGTTDTFSVVLNEAPIGDVVFDVTSGDTSEGTVSTATLTFTTLNWNTAQIVTVTGVDDAIVDGTISYDVTVAVNAAASEDNWDALADQTLTATNTNDDAATPVEPATEEFTDLHGLSAEAVDSINRLAALGITTGVADGVFAPQGVVVRSDMALFLVRELEAAGFTLPTASPTAFSDTAGLTVEAQTAVAILAELGITTGTSDGVFDPSGEVNRWQMAIFLTRVLDELGVTLPTSPLASFTDLGGYSVEAQLSIRQLADLGITTGTAAGVFSPDQVLPRWQMAIFLIRVIDEVT